MTTPETAPPRLPEGAHSSRFIRIQLAEFNQPGVPDCWVELRNIGLMSQDQIEAMTAGMERIQIGEDGRPVDDKAAMPTMYQQIVKLIRSWSMWDANSDDDIPPLLPSPPASIDDLKRAPAGALKVVLGVLEELQNPR